MQARPMRFGVQATVKLSCNQYKQGVFTAACACNTWTSTTCHFDLVDLESFRTCELCIRGWWYSKNHCRTYLLLKVFPVFIDSRISSTLPIVKDLVEVETCRYERNMQLYLLICQFHPSCTHHSLFEHACQKYWPGASARPYTFTT